jgi:hypothetical protein
MKPLPPDSGRGILVIMIKINNLFHAIYMVIGGGDALYSRATCRFMLRIKAYAIIKVT